VRPFVLWFFEFFDFVLFLAQNIFIVKFGGANQEP